MATLCTQRSCVIFLNTIVGEPHAWLLTEAVRSDQQMTAASLTLSLIDQEFQYSLECFLGEA